MQSDFTQQHQLLLQQLSFSSMCAQNSDNQALSYRNL